jgi:hypothetical protein
MGATASLGFSSGEERDKLPQRAIYPKIAVQLKIVVQL